MKFTIDPAEVNRLLSHPALDAAFRESRPERLVATYFDTPDGRLRTQKVALRIRRSADGRIIQTAKRSCGSRVDRDEWEQEVFCDRPDLDGLRRTPLKSVMTRRVAAEIAPRFTVDVERTLARVEEDGTEIEGAFDRGSIEAGGRVLPVCEFELEVKRGAPDALFRLARRLVTDLPLVLSLATKSERGHALSDGAWADPKSGIMPGLKGTETIAQAFETVVQDCLHALLATTAPIGDGADREAVHRARIAVRHLRAVLALFQPVLRRRRFAPLRDDVKWISDLLGDARDAEVIHVETIEPALRTGDVPGLPALAVVSDGERRRTHRLLLEGLASPRWRVFLVDLLAASGDGVRRRARATAYRPFVRRRLEDKRKRLARQVRGLATMTDDARHDVRKAAKMLRYALDLFGHAGAIGARKRVRRLGTGLQRLQQALGVLQDADTMRERFRTMFLGRSPPMGIPPRTWRDAAFAAGAISVASVGPKRLLRAADKAADIVKATHLKQKTKTKQ